jgi:hypothetical protein
MSRILLTRDQFREEVFARDKQTCVHCSEPGVDAHHILERRLFPDGGYYLENGVCLCATCHLEAEATSLSCEILRIDAGITRVILPLHVEVEGVYDKWLNPVLPNGQRFRGELFDEEGVQRALRNHLYLFSKRVKYPRTYHVPWSPNLQNDDRMMEDTSRWDGMQVVITEKMDGENTTMYNDYMHARSLEYESAIWRDRIKPIHGAIKHDIPEGFRICGENMSAVHSIHYSGLPSYFMMFSMWNDQNVCMSWDETREWGTLLGVDLVPTLYEGIWDEAICRSISDKLDVGMQEGLVIRPAAAFAFKDFRHLVGKWVRKAHVKTDQHWTRKPVEYNGLESET